MTDRHQLLTFSANHHNRLHHQSNDIQREQTDIAAHHVDHVIHRDASLAVIRATKQLQQRCTDILYTGLSLMIGIVVYQAWQRGTLAHLTMSCGSFPCVRGKCYLGIWGLTQLMNRSAEVLVCIAGAMKNILMCVSVFISVPWVLNKTRLLRDHHSLPVFQLTLGLGVLCATAGFWGVTLLGGDPWVWLVVWELWTISHITMSVAAQRMCWRVEMVQQQQQKRRAERRGSDGVVRKDGTGWWLLLWMWLILGGVMPVLAAVLPFHL